MIQDPGRVSTVRLPYNREVCNQYGVSLEAWKVLTDTVWPQAKNINSILTAISYCKARNLDPLKRVVVIVPQWDSNSRTNVETIWPTIAEVRITAHRTGEYVGCDAVEYGPYITEIFETSTGGAKKTVTYPEWASITVYRQRNGIMARFVGPRVKWKETYAKYGNTPLPNTMWERRPDGQLEKCAEAAALRRAFPEELGNTYTAEEMEGQNYHSEREAPASLPVFLTQAPTTFADLVAMAASKELPAPVAPSGASESSGAFAPPSLDDSISEEPPI